MRYLLVAALVLPLHGCLFFFWIPGSVIDKLSGWNACASEGVQVGNRLKHTDGRIGKVERVSGRSDRCQDGKLPVLVEVNFEQ